MADIRTFSFEQLREPLRLRDKVARQLLEEQRRPNVVGLAVGGKIKGGRFTNEPALMVLVTHKVPETELSSEDKIPGMIEDVKTDVLEVGFLQALVGLPFTERQTSQQDVLLTYHDGARAADTSIARGAPLLPHQIGIEQLTKRVRPAQGGHSVGHFQITAGTIATCVYDSLPDTIGIPPKYYILSNNHVLANSNNANLGDPILQPGPFDGGTNPADRIASLSRFVPIDFAPSIPLAQHNNLVDAAIAEGRFEDLDREIYWQGYAAGYSRRNEVAVGTRVKKTGRTTNATFGRILAIGATVDVNYGGSRVARFRDQIITTNMSAGGDSGSLILTLDNKAVGLLFAGSSSVTIANQIENVRSLLRIELWP